MLVPAFFVFLDVAGGKIAVADHHARPSTNRVELHHHARVARLRRELGRAPGLHDPPPFIDAQEDSVDVPVPGDEPAAAHGSTTASPPPVNAACSRLSIQ